MQHTTWEPHTDDSLGYKVSSKHHISQPFPVTNIMPPKQILETHSCDHANTLRDPFRYERWWDVLLHGAAWNELVRISRSHKEQQHYPAPQECQLGPTWNQMTPGQMGRPARYPWPVAAKPLWTTFSLTDSSIGDIWGFSGWWECHV